VTPHGHRLSVVAPVPCAGRSALVESVHIVAAVVRAAQLLVHIAPAVERNALVVRKAPGVEYNEQARRSERVACSPLLKPHNMVVEQRTAAAHRLCLPRRRLRVRLCRHKGCKMRWWLAILIWVWCLLRGLIGRLLWLWWLLWWLLSSLLCAIAGWCPIWSGV
jgi:hypothetical protein